MSMLTAQLLMDRINKEKGSDIPTHMGEAFRTAKGAGAQLMTHSRDISPDENLWAARNNMLYKHGDEPMAYRRQEAPTQKYEQYANPLAGPTNERYAFQPGYQQPAATPGPAYVQTPAAPEPKKDLRTRHVSV